MSLSLFLRSAVVCGCVLSLLPNVALGQATHIPSGGEYALTPAMPGDQVHPRLSIKPSGGYVVWQDNVTDGDDWGISAIKLDGGLSGTMSPFRVNATAADVQDRPMVSLLNDGGAAFVWQGGKLSYQHIYARFLAPDNTWTTSEDIMISSDSHYQIRPVITTLKGGNVVVGWASFDQRGQARCRTLRQVLTSTGSKVGSEFPVNQEFNTTTDAGDRRFGQWRLSLSGCRAAAQWQCGQPEPGLPVFT
jgi:hypothetical protein